MSHLQILKSGNAYKLTTKIWVPRTVNEVFDFFSDAANLEKLTPPWLNFSILTPLPIDMKRGVLIDYKIKLFGVPMKWKTLIARWEEGVCFVDQQLSGPYKKWVHLHSFKPENNGTWCLDEVDFYPLGGALVMPFVKNNLQKIFSYRHQRIGQLFK